MGREALVQADIGTETAVVRALLESTELILRGDIRRRFARADLVNVQARDGVLRFTAGGEVVSLHLGIGIAEAWAKAIATPPPSLRAKLGLANGACALLVGAFEDAALQEAIAGVTVDTVNEADMLIACVASQPDLDTALAIHAKSPALPLWAIYPKGKGVTFGDGEIRAALRGVGLRDTKTSAVSDRLTATRYQRPVVR